MTSKLNVKNLLKLIMITLLIIVLLIFIGVIVYALNKILKTDKNLIAEVMEKMVQSNDNDNTSSFHNITNATNCNTILSKVSNKSTNLTHLSIRANTILSNHQSIVHSTTQPIFTSTITVSTSTTTTNQSIKSTTQCTLTDTIISTHLVETTQPVFTSTITIEVPTTTTTISTSTTTVSTKSTTKSTLPKLDEPCLSTFNLDNEVLSHKLPKKCGKRKNQKKIKRIVNGEPTMPSEWPWIVSIHKIFSLQSYSLLCSGVLISSKHVLTTKSCLRQNNVPIDLNEIVIGMGLLNARDIKHNEKKHKVSKVFFYSNCNYDQNSNSFEHEIAILKLNEEITEFNDIRPICLPNTRDGLFVYGRDGYFAGWGSKNLQLLANEPQLLNQMKVLVINPNDPKFYQRCKALHRTGGAYFNESLFYCAIGADDRHPSSFEKGGPLIYEHNKRMVLYGLLNYVASNRYENQEQIHYYTIISHYINWIHHIVELN